MQDYIAAVPGWKREIGRKLDALKVAFVRGTSLRPVPPGASKTPETRYLDIHADDELDNAQLVAWVKQASQLPGEHI